MAAKQVLRDTGAKLEVTFYADETAINADGDSVDVTATKADGTALTGIAALATNEAGTGNYSVVVPPQATLNLIDVTFSGTFAGIAQSITTQVEIVGGFYAHLSELRALPNLDNTSKFTTAELVNARRWFETLAERYCGQAFVPRYRRARVDGTGSTGLLLTDWPILRILSARTYSDATTYETFDSSALADLVIDTSGMIRRATSNWTYGAGNIVLEYEHGHASLPEDIRQAALIAIRDRLLNDQTGRPMLSVADGAGGTTRFSLAGPDRPTGIPDVDVILNGYRIPAFA